MNPRAGSHGFRETTRADLNPPLNHLAYRPRDGRYCLLATWGYTIRPQARETGGGVFSRCELTVLDSATGEAVERMRPMRAGEAERIAVVLRERVQRLNRADAA